MARDGSRFLIEAAALYKQVENVSRGLLLALAIALPIVVAVAIGGGYTLMRRALHPIDEITRSAERITSRNLSERLPLAQTGDELERLSISLNQMIARLEEAFHYIRRFNYYIVRANALEGNVVLYKVENGKRTDLPLVGKGRTYWMKEKVLSGECGTLRVVAKGNHFEVYHKGKKLFEVEDETFKEGGRVGLWTKADSVIYFDDLQINML